MPTSPYLISVVIPAWNCAHIITPVLNALYQQYQKIKQFEIVIVNDYSQDNTGEIIEQYKTEHPDLPLTVIHQTTVGSSTRSRNCGMQHAHAPLILFLDADIITETDVVTQHLKLHQQHNDKHTVVLGQVASPKEWEETALDEVCNPSQVWNELQAGEVDWSHFFTGHISAHKNFLLSVGGFDENYLRCEDVELGSRLSVKKMRLYYLPTAIGYHYHRRSVAQELCNNQTYAEMFAYFYRHGSPIMRAYVSNSWFMETNSRVFIKRILGKLFANPVVRPYMLALADKLSTHWRFISKMIWNIVFFQVGYQQFQTSMKLDSKDLHQPKHPEHKT